MAASGRVDELKKRYDENPRRFFAPLANEYRKSGDLELAINLCRQHLAESPQNLSGQIVFGQALFDAGSLEEAESAFGTAISLDPENLIALRHLGDIARAQNDAVRARLWYQRVIDADPRNDEVAAIMAELPAESRPSDAVSVQGDAAPLEVEPTSLTEAPPGPPAPAAAEPVAAQSPAAEPPPSLRPTPAVSAQSLPDQLPVSQADIKTVEIPALPLKPRADADAISFADEPSATEERAAEQPASAPASPPPAVGFDVDFGAAAGLGMPDEPMMGAVGESSAFGSVDVPTESPFGTAEDFTPDSPFGTSGRGKSATPGYTAPTPSEVEAEPPVRPATPPRAASPIGPVRAVTPIPAPASLEFDVVDAAPPVRPRDVPARHPAAAGIEEFELEPAENDAATSPADAAPEAESFATETMAELYVKQGLRQKAIDVYRELIRARPSDEGLKARLAELEGDGRGAKRLTARTFFSAIATRRATPARPQTPPRDSAVVDDAPPPAEPAIDALPPAEPADDADATPRPSSTLTFIDTSEPEPEAPAEVAAEARTVEPATVDVHPDEEPARPARPTIDALFGHADVAAMDDSAAQSLAAAFGGARADVGGRPARAASDEVSLDEVFRRAGRETPSGGLAVPRQSATLRFDQFFAGGSAEQSMSQPDTAADPGGDSEQFQAWLNGLKKQ